MTAEQLRNSILQEAISGRLVPQDPNDEPASVLLQHIREEKARLLKAKLISKRDFDVLPITEDDVDFEIPTNWEWVRLGDIFKHSTGKALNEANRKGSLQDYITTSNVYWGYFKLDKLRQMYYTEDEKDKCMATKGDLLVLEGGDVGRAAIWDKDYDIFLQNHIHKLRAYIPVCTEFYYYCLYLFHDMGLVGGRGIGIQGLSSGVLHQVIFPLPPFAEQKRIVAKLEELLPIVDQYGKAQKELDELNAALPARLRNSILQEAMQGKLVPFTSYEKITLGQACEVIMGQSPDGSTYNTLGKGMEFHQGKALFGKMFLNKSNVYSSTPLKVASPDSIVMSVRAPVGTCNLLDRSICIGRGLAAIKPKSKMDLMYLYYLLESKDCLLYLDDHSTGTTFKAVSKKIIEDYAFSLPPLAEQQRIVAKIEELFAEIDKLK